MPFTVRTALPEDKTQVEAILRSMGKPEVNWNNFDALLIVENKRVVGLLGMEAIIHCGPVWIAPEYQGRHWYKILHDGMVAFLKSKGIRGSVYAFAPRKGTEEVYKKLGLVDMAWSVFRKDIK